MEHSRNDPYLRPMKIRILGTTIRLRIKMFESDVIRETGVIEEVLEFGFDEADKLKFQIRTGEDKFAIEQNLMQVAIIVPRDVIEKWTSTDMVGFEETITTSKGKEIKVLIEKDWACLDNDREPEEGSFPNPLEGTVC